ncbi:hypothetical protein Tco_1540502 [Tanacetum coccineum]
MSDSEDSSVTYTAVSSTFGEDEVLPAEEQSLPAAVSPTADSPGYIPIREEEHPALADSVLPPVHRVTARISIPAQAPAPFWFEADVDRFLAIRTPPPSPLTLLSSPLPQIPSPPLPVSSPLPVLLPPPASPTYPLGYRAAMIRQRAESPFTSCSLPLPPPIILSHTRASVAMMRDVALSTYILASRSETPPSGTPPLLPIPLPIPSPPLLLPFTDRRAERPKVCLPPQKRLCIALGPRYEVGENSSAPIARPTRGFRADYGFVATLDKEIRRDPERDVGYGIINAWDKMLEGIQDTDEIYGRLDEAQEARADFRLSHEARGRSLDTSDTARSEAQIMADTETDGSLQIHCVLQNPNEKRGNPLELYILLCVVISLTAALAARDAGK